MRVLVLLVILLAGCFVRAPVAYRWHNMAGRECLNRCRSRMRWCGARGSSAAMYSPATKSWSYGSSSADRGACVAAFNACGGGCPGVSR